MNKSNIMKTKYNLTDEDYNRYVDLARNHKTDMSLEQVIVWCIDWDKTTKELRDKYE